MTQIEIKPIHRIMASLIKGGRKELKDMPVDDREAVQYVLDTEFNN